MMLFGNTEQEAHFIGSVKLIGLRMKFAISLQNLICRTKIERIHKEYASWGSEFVARHIGEMEGVILEAEMGNFLGKHRGFWFYTIGQCQGLRLPGGPWYVVKKDIMNNVVFVSRNYYSFDKKRRLFRVGSLRWLSGLPPAEVDQLQCKVRHGPGFYNCSLSMEHDQEDVAVVQLSEDDQGLAAGQFAAFYHERRCIGSGVILESWDDQGFPVCEKALELVRMEDKSKLGKPVKIKVKPETPTKEKVKALEAIKTLRNAQNGVAKKRKTMSQWGTILRFPTNWLQKLKRKMDTATVV